MAKKPTYEELEQRVKELEKECLERKRAEEALRKSEEKFRLITENIRDVFYMNDSEKSQMLYVSPAYEEIWGRTCESLYEQPMSFLDTIHQEDRERVIATFDKQRRGESIEVDYRIMRPDGSVRWISSRAFPVQHELGELLCIVGIAEDRTEIKQGEETLRQSERKYRSLYESSKDGIAYSDIQGNLLDANQAFSDMLGYTIEELTELTYQELTPRKWHEMEQDIVKNEIMTRGYSGGYEKELTKKDGSVVPVTIRVWLTYDEEGNQSGMWGMVRDITERKRAEEEKKELEAKLQQSQKMEAIGTLAGGIAHNFNNLLMGIQGNVSLMLMDMDSTHPHYERLRKIEKQVQSGARLTSYLLGYARKGRYYVKPLNLNRLVEDTSDMFGRTKREIAIHRDLAEDLLGIEADEGQIEQVLLNMCVNAADAMPGGGDLSLKTMNVTHKDMKGKLYDPKPGNYVVLKVTDTGSGMDKETMDRIFDPFFTTKEMGRGTGLGLASTYGIIKAHGGYIDVESELGRGTTFTIYLPASEKKVQKAVETAKQIIEGRGTILFVDDEAVILDMGVKVLKRFGYTVLEAKGGREAVEIYKAKKDAIDLVILDMIMPKMGGGEAYDRMKEINPNVKVLLSSGYSIDGQATEILERGCDSFIQKPFDMKELSQAIREVLGKE